MIREVKQLAVKFFPETNTIFYSRNDNKLSCFYQKDLIQTDVFIESGVIHKYNCDCQKQLLMVIRVHKHKSTFYKTRTLQPKPNHIV